VAEVTAVYRAVADFSALKRQADAARRSLRQLRTESSDTHQDYVAGQEEVTEATDDSTQANVGLTKALGKVSKATRQTTKVEETRVGVLQDTVAEIGKQSEAQRENTRLEIAATRAKDNLSLAEDRYTRVATNAEATDRDRAKALDDVRLASIGAAAANDQLVASMARLAVGGGGRGGRPRGPGIATDVGGFGRALATVGAGLLSTLLLVIPTINVIIAGIVGLVALLGSAVVAATAFAAAFLAVGAAMAFAAFKWRSLLTDSADGVTEWKASILAIEAAAFEAFKNIVEGFKSTGEAGTSMWDSIAQAGITLIGKVAPYIQKVVDAVYNFTQALAGVPGAASPLMDFLRTWIDEWKVLKDIVNEDILPGGPSFFSKYEAPAKAFVEGIARVINGVRKFSRLGLGLNMDQLAEFITNVFDALAKLIQIIPRYSNALVSVGLATSEWLNALIPIIDAAVKIGEVILKDLVAPLVEFAGFVTTHILNLPIISWLTSLAAGFAIAAFGLSKLSFGLISFKSIMTGALIRSLITFVGLVKEFGFFQTLAGYMPGVVQGFQKLGGAVTTLGTGLTGLTGAAAAGVGSLAIGAVVLGGWFLINRAMDAARKRQEALGRAAERTKKILASGAITIAEAYQRLATSYQAIQAPVVAPARARSLEKLGVDVDKSGEAAEYAREEIAKWGNEISQNAVEGVSATGALTDEQAKYLNILKDGEGTQQYYRNFLMQVNDLYDKGVINAGQYATILDELGVSTNAAGDEVDLLALKVEGASNTIAQSLLEVEKNSNLATTGLGRFATAMGEDVTSFTRDAVEAFNDVQGGLLGTGEKVTEWFQSTADAIEQWKTETADAFNFVKEAFSGLADNAKITFEKIRNTLQDAIVDQQEYNQNWRELVRLGASQELLQQVKDLGLAGGNVISALVSGGRQGINQIDQLVRRGGDLAGNLANSMANALGVTMEKLTAAVELFISKMLGIPVDEVRAEVDRIVENTNKATGKVIPLSERIRGTGREAEMRRSQARAAETYVGGLQAQAVTPPGENTERQMRSRYEAIGRAGVTGLAVGLSSDTRQVKQASDQLAKTAIDSTNDAFGISSPARAFISIGGAVMEGLAQGFRNGTTLIVTTLTGVRDQIIGVFANAATWLGGITTAFKNLYRVISEDLVPAVDDLYTSVTNLPESISIDFDLDTSKAEEAANAFLENMEKKGLIFQTGTGPGGKQVLHEGGPAGRVGRFATGRPRSGEVDARLQRGEYVFSRKSVESMGGLGEMDAFHSFLQGKRLFHDGGPVDESEVTSAKIRRLAESLGISGVTATGVLPKQKMQPLAQVSAPGAGKTAGGLTAAAANYMAVIKKNFPQITGYGTIAVRNIAGTNTWSQHAYGNAIDVMTGASTAMRQAVAFFSNQYRRILSIAHLLADPWFASPLGDHYNHVHADFFPQYGGTPPGQPYRAGGKVRKRGGRVHANEFVLREGAAAALGTSGLDYLNTHADRYGPAAFLEAFNRSFATTAIPRMGGIGAGADGADGRALFSIAMHLDGKTISRSVDVHSREADILLPGR
jgi:hypothetical protein